MPTTVNTHEAKTHLSRLLAEVEAGGEVIIARAGRPVARLTAVEPGPVVRQLGTGAAFGHLNPGWEEPDWTDEEIEEWENASLFPEVDQ